MLFFFPTVLSWSLQSLLKVKPRFNLQETGGQGLLDINF